MERLKTPEGRAQAAARAKELLEMAAKSENAIKPRDRTSELVTAANEALFKAGKITGQLVR